ncbi:MAG TPA: mersacidin/lichenicidin family type 2 lantibiotic [Thermoanaerobaculia bacterium]|jgi:mersacidin/lichenicidin family type 2 lantibiotic
MNKTDVIRAWKDPLYRARLSREEASGLPTHPSGVIDLEEKQLQWAAGGVRTTYRTCTVYTSRVGCCP